MADDESANDGPSLELPSFSLRRKKKRDTPSAGPTHQPEPAPEPDPQPDPQPAPEPDPEPEPEPTPEPPSRRLLGRRKEQAPPADEPADEPTEEPERVARAEAPTEVMPPPLFVDEAAPEPAPAPVSPPQTEDASDPDPEAGAGGARVRAERGPGGYAAAALTGLVVGLLMVVATWGALQGCEAVRGTSSCGQPGFLVLLAMLVLAVVVGTLLLKALRVRDPASTSVLGVGLVAVVSLLAFIDVIYDWWMFLAVPALGVISFALAHTVTSAFVETTGDDRHR